MSFIRIYTSIAPSARTAWLRVHCVYIGYVASSHSIQSYIKRVLKMLLSELLASSITFSIRVEYMYNFVFNDYEHHILIITLLIAALNNAFWQDYMYFFVETNAAIAFNNVLTSHLVLHVSNTRKYVMAILTRIQGKLCD